MERRDREEDLYKTHTERLKCDLGNLYLCVCAFCPYVLAFFFPSSALRVLRSKDEAGFFFFFPPVNKSREKPKTNSIRRRLSGLFCLRPLILKPAGSY